MARYLFLLFICFAGRATAHGDVLEKYIQEGLQNNLTLKQSTFSLQHSSAALKEARGMFLPSVSIEARYSRAGGGRLIEIPVGDLTNPIYSTLNDLLSSIGQPPAFPENLPNEYIPFLREEEHETKIRVIQPVFQPAILHNYKIKKLLTQIEDASRRVFARQLVEEIKTAYFNYLKTVKIDQLLRETAELLEENVRINESLYENDKVTIAAVHRAKAELAELEGARAEADKNIKLARNYFNFLLNRSLDTPIDIAARGSYEQVSYVTPDEAAALALQNREELTQLALAVKIAGQQVGLVRAEFLPGLSLVADYGFQGEEYSFTEKDDYWMASALLQWNIFNGFQDKNRIQQAKLDKNAQLTKLSELRRQIELQTNRGVYDLEVARKSILAAEQRVKSARLAFRLIERKYREGMAAQIEYIDARTSMTNAETNYIVAGYELFIRQAVLEKITATYPVAATLQD